MSKSYKNRPLPHASVQELPTVTATALKNSIADVFDQVAAGGAIAITRHDKPRAVMLSVEAYEALKTPPLPGLDAIQAEYHEMFRQMQEPAQRAGMTRLFEATSEELGEAALKACRQTKLSKSL